jgi:serine protease Do
VGATFPDIVEKLRRVTVQVKPVQMSAQRNASGSGVIWSRDGVIVTNAHVVEGAGRSGARDSGIADVELWDGRRLPAKIVRRDRRRDLAALHIQTSGLPAVTAGDSNALRVGELVIAVGNPLGFIGAASTGVVHGFANGAWVVSQLRLAPGNSGGPLANARGEVVGINTMIGGGLAFAIPSRSVTQFLSAQAKADSGLGVVVRPVLAAHSEQSPTQQLGLIVLEVIPHSPADCASLLQGDILVGARGKRFQSIQDLEIAIHASSGGILELQFRRGASANIRTVVVQMAAHPVKAA